MTNKRIILIVLTVVALVAMVVVPLQCMCTVDAGEIVVHQSLDGDLTVWYEPGWKLQGFGDITRYKKSAQFDFTAPSGEHQAKTDEQKAIARHDNSIKTRFNDNGEARVSGSVSYDLPTEEEKMLKLHSTFRSMEGIEDRLVRRTIEKAVTFTGPLMSSRESAGQRRGEVIHFIIDQAIRGVYQTKSEQEEIDDLLAPPVEVVEMIPVPLVDEETGEPKLDDKGNPIMVKKPKKISRPAKKTIMVTQPVEKNGHIEVQESSALADFGIKLYNLTVNDIIYDQKVKEQIDMQRKAIMDIQTKIAEGQAAEQRRLTVEKEGQAEAAKAKWDQEVKKSQAVTEAQQQKAVAIEQAEQRRAVAEKDLEAAKLERQAKIERAQGDARAKKLIMEADGALKEKLSAYVQIQQAWANAIGGQPLVPTVNMAGHGSGNEGMNMMQLLTVKAAKDLALDMGVNKSKR